VIRRVKCTQWVAALALLGLTILGAMHMPALAQQARETGGSFRELPLQTVLAAALWMILAALSSGVTWHLLMRHLGYPTTLRLGLRTFLSAGLGGYVVNSLGPIAGCAASLRRHGICTRRAALLTLMANVLGFMSVVCWAPAGLVLLAHKHLDSHLPLLGRAGLTALASVAALAVIVLLGILLMLGRGSRSMHPWARRILGAHPDNRGDGKSSASTLAAALGIGIVSWPAGAMGLYGILVALNPNSPPALGDVLGCSVLAALIGSLAFFAPEGLGASDGSLVILLLHATHCSLHSCLAAALTMRLLDPLAKISLLCLLASGSVCTRIRAAVVQRLSQGRSRPTADALALAQSVVQLPALHVAASGAPAPPL